MGEAAARKRVSRQPADALAVPSGESPDGTGWQPVLPKTEFSERLSVFGAWSLSYHSLVIASSKFRSTRETIVQAASCFTSVFASDLRLTRVPASSGDRSNVAS
jgi:hypothetical protein